MHLRSQSKCLRRTFGRSEGRRKNCASLIKYGQSSRAFSKYNIPFWVLDMKRVVVVFGAFLLLRVSFLSETPTKTNYSSRCQRSSSSSGGEQGTKVSEVRGAFPPRDSSQSCELELWSPINPTRKKIRSHLERALFTSQTALGRKNDDDTKSAVHPKVMGVLCPWSDALCNWHSPIEPASWSLMG